MAYTGQIIENPVSGERITFLRTAADTNGEYLAIELELTPDGHVPGMHVHQVTDWDPPRLLGYTWAKEGERPDHLLWELHPHDDGCLLVLTHTFEDRLKAARDGAGWHICLDALAAELDGGGARPSAEHEEGPWPVLNSEYQGRFGISPDEATPPPLR